MADELNRPEIKNFIEAFVEEDIGPGGQYEGMQVHTRFPPEPNGYLHIGHCKALCIDFGTAEKFGGICNLRMDDTNPTKEDTEYVEAIKEDIRWLGFTWDDRFYYARIPRRPDDPCPQPVPRPSHRGVARPLPPHEGR